MSTVNNITFNSFMDSRVELLGYVSLNELILSIPSWIQGIDLMGTDQSLSSILSIPSWIQEVVAHQADAEVVSFNSFMDSSWPAGICVGQGPTNTSFNSFMDSSEAIYFSV